MAFGFPPPGTQQLPAAPAPVAPAVQGGNFTEALKQPEVQAALIQFGLNMLTPSRQGFFGQAARSLGSAGQAAKRVTEKREKSELERRLREQQERELNQGDRRLDIAEKGLKGKGLQSFFTKPKNFQDFLHDYVKLKASTLDMIDADPTALMNDPKIQQEAYQAWQKTLQMGEGGGLTQSLKKTEAQLRADAAEAIARGAPADAVNAELARLLKEQ
jgi:hypothetical protein